MMDRLNDYYRAHGFLARHEAGHTVVAFAMRREVERVVALDTEGRTVIKPYVRFGYSRDDRENDIMIQLAGMRAERSHFAWTEELRARWPRSMDHAYAEEDYAILRLGAAEEADLRVRLVQQVDGLLERHRRFLDNLHDALARDRILSRTELLELRRASVELPRSS